MEPFRELVAQPRSVQQKYRQNQYTRNEQEARYQPYFASKEFHDYRKTAPKSLVDLIYGKTGPSGAKYVLTVPLEPPYWHTSSPGNPDDKPRTIALPFASSVIVRSYQSGGAQGMNPFVALPLNRIFRPLRGNWVIWTLFGPTIPISLLISQTSCVCPGTKSDSPSFKYWSGKWCQESFFSVLSGAVPARSSPPEIIPDTISGHQRVRGNGCGAASNTKRSISTRMRR